MCKNMLVLVISLFLISTVCGSGEFTVLHHPPGLLFKGHDHLKQSTLKEVYAAALGFSTEHYSNWQGMYIESPFDLPEAIVTVSVDGLSDINQQKGHNFPLKTDISESEVFESLERSVLAHSPVQNPKLVRIELSNGLDVRRHSIFVNIHRENPKHITSKVLKLDIDEDRAFLKEISLLHAITEKIEQKPIKRDNVRDVYWFQLTSLHALSDLHGENSTETVEAKQLLNEAVLKLNAAFIKAYDGYVLVNIITSDASHTRRARNILQATTPTPPPNDKQAYNLASYYTQDYPAIFNIILWFGIMMVFSLIAICLAINNMDPGRDSIIYRMTNTRMKKDN